MKCQSLIPNTIVLQQTKTSSIEMFLISNQMHWVEYLNRMEDVSVVLQSCGKFPIHKPKKCFKEVIKNNLRVLSMYTLKRGSK